MFGRKEKRVERQAARALSAELDRALRGGSVPEAGDPLLQTACRLQRIGDAMPAVPSSLERRVRATLCTPALYRPTLWQRWRPALLGALVATIVLLGLWTMTPGGQAAWAQMLSVLPLGQTRIVLTPEISADQSRAVRAPLRDLVAVEVLIGRAPSVPRTLPEGYALQAITAVSYPDMPAWISQPFYVELCYGPADVPTAICLREYRLLFREIGGISGLNVASEKAIELEQVEVAGVEGALLFIDGEVPRYAVVWERDGLLLEMESAVLGKEALLAVAQTVR